MIGKNATLGSHNWTEPSRYFQSFSLFLSPVHLGTLYFFTKVVELIGSVVGICPTKPHTSRWTTSVFFSVERFSSLSLLLSLLLSILLLQCLFFFVFGLPLLDICWFLWSYILWIGRRRIVHERSLQLTLLIFPNRPRRKNLSKWCVLCGLLRQEIVFYHFAWYSFLLQPSCFTQFSLLFLAYLSASNRHARDIILITYTCFNAAHTDTNTHKCFYCSRADIARNRKNLRQNTFACSDKEIPRIDISL